MNNLFEKTMINGLELDNRFVRSATWEGLADKEGAVTPGLIEKMQALATGGVGLIISGHAYIEESGKATPGQLGVYKDELLEGLSELTRAVHAHNGKILLQLAHAGNFALKEETGLPPRVVSNISGWAESPRQELSLQEIGSLLESYRDAARRAKTAGFDGIQLHAAHGYLLSQFLSPYFNRRTDQYGGKIENRVRIILEIISAVRMAVGDGFPLLIKMNCEDFDSEGLGLKDALHAAKLLEKAGIDAIELSGGLLTGGKLSPSRPRIRTKQDEAYFRDQAKQFKNNLEIPLILVGGMRSLSVARGLIEKGVADYISLSRPLIREPNLINRWKAGEDERAACKSDNLCFNAAFDGGVYCVSSERERKKIN